MPKAWIKIWIYFIFGKNVINCFFRLIFTKNILYIRIRFNPSNDIFTIVFPYLKWKKGEKLVKIGHF